MALITRPFGSGIFDGNNLEQIETHPDSLILQRAQRHLLHISSVDLKPRDPFPLSWNGASHIYRKLYIPV